MAASHLLSLAALLTSCWWVYHNVWLFVRETLAKNAETALIMLHSRRATIMEKTRAAAV